MKFYSLSFCYADINECLEGTDGCGQICSNTDGSYACTCNTGYRLDANRHSCNGNCVISRQFLNCNSYDINVTFQRLMNVLKGHPAVLRIAPIHLVAMSAPAVLPSCLEVIVMDVMVSNYLNHAMIIIIIPCLCRCI